MNPPRAASEWLPRDPLGLMGTVIDGRYLVEESVGAGGFGIVYRARHFAFDAPVALKVLAPSGHSSDGTPRLAAPGGDEGRLLFRLSALHHSFVRVFESGTIPRERGAALRYLAMEWLDGLSLKAHLDTLHRAGRGLPLPTVLHLFDDLVAALAIAHEQCVAHRDVKPANVYLSVRQGYVDVKLLDLGLAKECVPRTAPFEDSSPRSSAFTPAYGAPEQWARRLGDTGPWTDVYSLALVLVEVLAGGSWGRAFPQMDLVALAHDADRRPTPRALGVLVGDEVEACFRRALSVDPRERYQDVSLFWGELRSAAGWSRPAERLSVAAVGIDERCAGPSGTVGRSELTALPSSTWTPSEPAATKAVPRPPSSADERGSEVESGQRGGVVGVAGEKVRHSGRFDAWRRISAIACVSAGVVGVLAFESSNPVVSPETASGDGGLPRCPAVQGARSAAPQGPSRGPTDAEPLGPEPADTVASRDASQGQRCSQSRAASEPASTVFVSSAAATCGSGRTAGPGRSSERRTAPPTRPRPALVSGWAPSEAPTADAMASRGAASSALLPIRDGDAQLERALQVRK